MIISIDQSYTSTGLCVFDKTTLLNFHLFTSIKDSEIFDRAISIADQINAVIKQTTDLEYVAIEGLAFSKFGNATRDLAGLQWLIVADIKRAGYTLKIIPPNNVKKVATGRGNAKKPEMFETLPEVVKQRFIQSGAKKTKGLYDLTDAYWIGIASQT